MKKPPARPANTGTHPLKRTRRICLALPDVTEKISWGELTWRVGKPYVGQKRWVGVRISGKPDWKAVESVVKDAHAFVASSRASR